MRVTITIVEARNICVQGKTVKSQVQFYRRGIHHDDKVKTRAILGSNPTYLHSFTRYWRCRPNYVSLVFEIYNVNNFWTNELLGTVELSLDDYTFIRRSPLLINAPIKRIRNTNMNIPLIDAEAELLIQITPEDFGFHKAPYVYGWTTKETQPEIILDLEDVIQICCTSNVSYFLTEKGEIYKCSSASDKPQRIDSITSATQIAAGDGHLLFIKENIAWAIGDNTYGQLGTGDHEAREFAVSVQLSPGAANAKQVYAGPNTSFVQCHNGDVWAFGNNLDNQLSVRNEPTVPRPRLIDIKYAHGVYPYDTFTLAICHGAMYYTGKMNEYDSETWTHLMMGKRFTNVISAGPMLYGLSKEGVVFKLDTIKDETIGIREIRNKKIVQLVAGKNHVLAMDEKGATHTWQATPTARVTRTGLSKASYIAAGGNTCVALSNSLQL